MRRVRSLVHLVAQREALWRLESQDSTYTLHMRHWDQQLLPAERQALRAYDEIVTSYIRNAPRPIKSTSVH